MSPARIPVIIPRQEGYPKWPLADQMIQPFFAPSSLIGLLPNSYIIFASLLGMADVFIYCIGGAYPCSKVVSDTIGFTKITGPLYAALGLVLGYKSPTQVLQTGAGLGLPLLLVGILSNVSGIPVDFRPAASQWLIVNVLTFGVPPLAALVGAFGGALFRLRLRPTI